jgi:hypothetical protein
MSHLTLDITVADGSVSQKIPRNRPVNGDQLRCLWLRHAPGSCFLTTMSSVRCVEDVTGRRAGGQVQAECVYYLYSDFVTARGVAIPKIRPL